MSTRNPSYVRLSERAATGCAVDLASGWGISGEDVRKFPSDDQAASEYARSLLRLGVLEEAGKAEWDAVHEGDLAPESDENVVVLREAPSLTESQIQRGLKGKRAKLVNKSGRDATEYSDDDDEIIIEESEETDDETGETTVKTKKRKRSDASV